MARIFGIDLGTTNSLIATMEKASPQVIADPATGSALLPSVVAIAPDGDVFTGGRPVGMEPHLSVEKEGPGAPIGLPPGGEGAVVRAGHRHHGPCGARGRAASTAP